MENCCYTGVYMQTAQTRQCMYEHVYGVENRHVSSDVCHVAKLAVAGQTTTWKVSGNGKCTTHLIVSLN